MSKFLNELRDEVLDTADNPQQLSKIRDSLEMISSLGENAQRMLEIGIVQDELVELGAVRDYNGPVGDLLCGYLNKISFYYPHKQIELIFWFDWVQICYHENYNYTSSNWQEDLINKVKELIK